MNEDFSDNLYNEITHRGGTGKGNLIKKKNAKITGKSKVSIEEESDDGIKIILKKDKNDNIKEIKFVCSCGQTKSIMLDYSE